MAGIESQIIQGGCGDLLVVEGKYADGSSIRMSLTCELKTDAKGQVYKDRNGVYWKRGGKRRRSTRAGSTGSLAIPSGKTCLASAAKMTWKAPMASGTAWK